MKTGHQRFKTIWLAALVGLLPPTVRASHDTLFSIMTAEAANNQLLANPPLPMVFYHKGEYLLGVKPYLYSGSMDDMQSGQTLRQFSDFSGWGAGANLSYAFAERWGAYAFVVGNKIKGDFRFYGSGPGAPPGGADSKMNGSRATFINANVGLAWQALGNENKRFALTVFGGPLWSKVKLEQNVTYQNPFSTRRHDFDMEADSTLPGLLLGVQAGIKLGEKFRLNPFLIMGDLNVDEFSYKVTRVNFNDGSGSINNAMAGLVEPNTLSGEISSIGINLLYRPWGLSMNLTSPFLSKPTVSEVELDMKMFSISWAFGNYTR